jgi:UrcA family protein
MTHTTSHSRLHPLWIGGIAALLVAGTPHAFAGDFEKGTSIKVKFARADLDTAEGVKSLYRKIEGAARRVCNEDSLPGDPQGRSHWRYCYETAVANAVKDVNNQQLTAMFQHKIGQAPVG